MIIVKIIAIIIIICIVLLFVFWLVNTSDFGESSLDMTDEEYNEVCKEYQKYWGQMRSEEEFKGLKCDTVIIDEFELPFGKES